MLMVCFKYRLPLRELEGFFQFLSNLMDIPKVPSYTQICRRMRSIQLPEELMNNRNVTDLVMDTTGLKVYGDKSCLQRSTLKQVSSYQQKQHAHDTTHLEKALDRCNRKKGKVLFDGIADSKRCQEICRKGNKKLLTPPNRKALRRGELEQGLRNDALRIIKGLLRR